MTQAMTHAWHTHEPVSVNHPAPIADHPDGFDRAAVAGAWQAFVAGQPFDRARVRDRIVESWERSTALGVDPRGACAPLVDGAGFARRLAANRELLFAVEHTWQLLSESLAASDNVIVVTDADGVTLEVRGNEELVAAAARQNVGAGRDWNEAASGTNAIGTALALDGPVIVRSEEHFCEAAKIWDCAASLVRDLDDGTVLGVLDVTSVGDLSDSHTLALAVTAAHLVEHSLHSQALARTVQLLNWYRAATDEDVPSLLLDRKGRIIKANAGAQQLADPESLKVRLLNGAPVLADEARARIVQTMPYRPPEAAAGENAWFGGAVTLEHSGQRRVVAAGDRSRADVHPAFRRIVTTDAGMRDLMRRAERMARAASPILLHGETGSGKELFAHAIHDCSGVASGPFVAVNCGTLTRELAASELLGYEAGAFTGAASAGRAGKFEQAHGGTLFLDEIGELSLDVQVHLLRVLQDNVVVRVGGNRERSVNVRIIAATHRLLEDDVAQGRFRSDLLFRLRVLSLSVPPLRERRGDIGLLVSRYLQHLHATYGLGSKRVSETLLETLTQQAWPGNVRELHALLESMYILSDRAVLSSGELPDDFAAEAAPGPRTVTSPGGAGGLANVEREAIVGEIARQRHNMAAVARALGISRSTLYRKLRQYGIEPRRGA